MARICTRAERQARRCVNQRAAPIPPLATPAVLRNASSLHDLRVACRRTRVALAEFGDVIAPGPRRDARDSLRDVRRRLGKVRELDVNLSLLKDFAEQHPEAEAYARDRLERERAAACEALSGLGAELDSQRWEEMLDSLRHAFRRTTHCYRKQAEQRLKSRLKKLDKQYRVWQDTQRPDDLHDLRIRFKKMRYTLEVYAGLYGKDGTKVLSELETAQDALGVWNDYRTLYENLRAFEARTKDSVRDSYFRLLDGIQATRDAKLDSVNEQTRLFFKKSRLRAMKQLFGKPKSPCCD